MIDPALLVAVTGFIRFIEGNPKYLTVADLERAQAIPRKIRVAVKRYVSGEKWNGIDLEKVGFDWRKLSKAIGDFDAEDITLMEKLIDGLPDSSQISGGYVGALQRIVQYATDKMPRNADVQMTGIRERKPSPLDVYRWQRCVTIAEEPLYALRWLHDGRLTGAAVDCLGACYPSILEMMTSAIVDALATMQLNGAWNLPRAKENQLSIFLGSFAAPGLQQAIQSLLDEESAKQQSKSPPTGASKLGKSYHATSKET